MSNLPIEFQNRIEKLFNENAEEIISTFDRQKPSTFRVNTLKTTITELREKLAAQGFELKESNISNAFILGNRTQRELTETEEYKNGLLYIQGLSSMLPPLILDPKPNETVLDMCAAPGSKTTQLSALMNNTGQVIANDMSKIRLYKLAANIKTLGVTNIQTLHMRAQDLWRRFPNTFDKVLVDVPCSLEGRFNTNYPKSYAQWSVKKIKILSEHQKHILRSAISCAKVGGTIVYSTCTLAPEENEGVIDWILSKEKNIKLEKIEIKDIKTQEGVTAWENKEYSPEVKKTVRISPSETMEAFFVAKIKRC